MKFPTVVLTSCKSPKPLLEVLRPPLLDLEWVIQLLFFVVFLWFFLCVCFCVFFFLGGGGANHRENEKHSFCTDLSISRHQNCLFPPWIRLSFPAIPSRSPQPPPPPPPYTHTTQNSLLHLYPSSNAKTRHKLGPEHLLTKTRPVNIASKAARNLGVAHNLRGRCVACALPNRR